MSYLRGPLTRDQVKNLMEPVRKEFPGSTTSSVNDDASAPAPGSAGGSDEATHTRPHAAKSIAGSSERPILPAAIREQFLPVSERVPDGYQLQYRPGLLGKGKLHYVQSSSGVDVWQDCVLVQAIRETPPDDIWDGATVLPTPPSADAQPDDSGIFADVPAELARDKSYPIFQRQLSDHLYRTAALKLWACEASDQYSQPGEKQEDFRKRLQPTLAQCRDAERQQIQDQFGKKTDAIDGRLQVAAARASAQRWQFFSKIASFIWVVVDNVLRVKGMGGRGRARSPEVALRGMATEKGQQDTAQASYDQLAKMKADLESQRDKALADSDAKYNADNLALTPFELKPRKGDISVDHVTLLWLPYRVNAANTAEPVYDLPTADS
jgi:hypothetical protein